MKKPSGKLAGIALPVLAALSLFSAPTWAASEYAMIMNKAAESMLLDIAAAGDRLVAVGERGHILYSNDDGASWTQAQVPASTMLTRVFFISAEQGWAVGHDGNILHSRDGGINWELQRDGVSAQAQINEERAGRAKITVESLYEQVKNTPEEARAELEELLEEAALALDRARDTLDQPIYAPPLMDIWFANAEQGWASGAYGVLLHTSNGGRHWDDWSHKVGNPDELHLNGVVGAADGTLYLASEWGTVFRSTSNGATWEPMETGYEGSFFGVETNPTTNSIFAYGLLGTIYRSTDQGENWEPLQSKAGASLFGSIATADGILVFVGQGGTAVRSQDDGENFTTLVQPSRAGIHGIAPMGDGRFMVTGDGGSHELATPSAANRGTQE
jgi:photosystem II stability/assembly factor-like uncharacterized protein